MAAGKTELCQGPHGPRGGSPRAPHLEASRWRQAHLERRCQTLARTVRPQHAPAHGQGTAPHVRSASRANTRLRVQQTQHIHIFFKRKSHTHERVEQKRTRESGCLEVCLEERPERARRRQRSGRPHHSTNGSGGGPAGCAQNPPAAASAAPKAGTGQKSCKWKQNSHRKKLRVKITWLPDPTRLVRR